MVSTAAVMTGTDKRVARWGLGWLGVGLFLLGTLVALLMMAGAADLVSTDDYYHVRIAAEMLEQRSLRVHFPWLPLTILNEQQFVDHHLLYHVYLAPFAAWGGMVGAKLAQSLVFGAIMASFWALLRQINVRYAWLWTLALIAISTPFLYRMIMARAQGAAVLLLLLTLMVLFSGRWRWLVACGFAFTWLYNGFILLPLIAGAYCAAVWLGERRFVWLPVAFVVLGIALGLVINPYFPQNIVFAFDHLGEKVDIAGGVRVGSEWYPYTTGALLENSPGMLLALAAAALAPSLRRARRDSHETTLLFVALLTLYMMFESRRFIEYAPPFALLWCAVALGRADIAWRDLLPRRFQPLAQGRVVLAMSALLLSLAGWWTASSVYRDLENRETAGYMAGAAAWLQANTPPGSRIFQTDWDDFPYLFFYNTHNTYLVGLDPTYLQVADPTLWSQWVAITDGDVERPSVLIRENFGAQYVVSDTRHDDFAQRAEQDPELVLVYRDSHSLIWQIADPAPER